MPNVKYIKHLFPLLYIKSPERFRCTRLIVNIACLKYSGQVGKQINGLYTNVVIIQGKHRQKINIII